MGWAELVRGMRAAIVLLRLICAASAATMAPSILTIQSMNNLAQ
jgi:hypothetical protein